MKNLLNELNEKYQIQLDTVGKLIHATDSEKEPENLSKYRTIFSFIKNFIYDIDNLKNYVEEKKN